MEKSGRHPFVQMNKKLLEQRYVGRRKKRAYALKKESIDEVIKQERMSEVVEEAVITLENLDAIDELESTIRTINCSDEHFC